MLGVAGGGGGNQHGGVDSTSGSLQYGVPSMAVTAAAMAPSLLVLPVVTSTPIWLVAMMALLKTTAKLLLAAAVAGKAVTPTLVLSSGGVTAGLTASAMVTVVPTTLPRPAVPSLAAMASL